MIAFQSSSRSASRQPAAKPFSARLTPPGSLPTHEQIAQRAYEIYVNSGYISGHCDENWLQAERELLEETLDAEV